MEMEKEAYRGGGSLKVTQTTDSRVEIGAGLPQEGRTKCP